MFGIFKKENRHLSSCMLGLAVCLTGKFKRETADLIAGQFCNDYHELYAIPREKGLEAVHANLFIATSILENIANGDFHSNRSNFNSDDLTISLVVYVHANIACLMTKNPEQKKIWQTNLSKIEDRFPDLAIILPEILNNEINNHFIGENLTF